MSLSQFAKEIIEKVFDKLGDVKNATKSNTVEYAISISDNRDDPISMSSSFKFKKPISEEELEKSMPSFIDILSDHLTAQNLGVINAVMRKYGFKTEKMGVSKVTGVLATSAGEVLGEVGEGLDSLTSIRSKSGRFISLNNFQTLLDNLVRGYMMKHMTSGGPQLKNRTGRFIAGTSMLQVKVVRSGISNLNTLIVVYGYQTNPYETFDPAGPNGRGLATVDRNPRKIIGDAIAKAVDDLVNMRFYKLEVLQR
jgi:hypothetical protein